MIELRSTVHVDRINAQGFNGIGRLLDPILRIYFSPKFERAMDEHVKAEFPRLRDVVRAEERPPSSRVIRDA